MSHMAASDSLTGLANHRRLLEAMEMEIERCLVMAAGFWGVTIRSRRTSKKKRQVRPFDGEPRHSARGYGAAR